MLEYSEQDLKQAAEFRDGIHREALAIVRKTRPDVTEVIDRHPVEDYFQEIWDYPGQWYTIIAVPYGYSSRKAIVDAIVRNTLSGGRPEAESDEHVRKLRKKMNFEQYRRKPTSQLDSAPDGYRELFTVESDRKNGKFRAVGVDSEGRYILEQFEEHSVGSVTGSTGSYFVLSESEYRRFARLALVNGQLKKEDYERLTTQPAKTPAWDGDPFYTLLAGYPDLVVDYCIVKNERYSGYESHRRALKTAFDVIRGELEGDPGQAAGKIIAAEELFSTDGRQKKLSYRKAFLDPPHKSGYTGKDFDRVNAALFPNGTDGLEVYEWTTDWSDYFDDGHEWWGTLCLTVYDRTLDRFAVIMASATD